MIKNKIKNIHNINNIFTKKNQKSFPFKKQILCSILSLFLGLNANFSYAQTNSTGNSGLNLPTNLQNPVLEDNLKKQEYNLFLENFSNTYKDDKDKKAYLMSKLATGHPVIYWTLAEQLSKDIMTAKYKVQDKNVIGFAKQIIYIAVIMTEQDMSSCIDMYARNGHTKTLAKHPYIVDLERLYPYENKINFEKSATFVNNLPNRPSSAWICLEYGDKENTGVYGKLYSDSSAMKKQALERLQKAVQ